MDINNLKKARERKGITKKQAAKALGISDSAYRNYELGNREPNNSLLVRLADLYGVTTDFLLGREVSSTKDYDLHLMEQPSSMDW